jgi:hypothetical protein
MIRQLSEPYSYGLAIYIYLEITVFVLSLLHYLYLLSRMFSLDLL